MVTRIRPIDASGHGICLGSRVLAAIGLIYFAPVLLAAAALIKCGSSGPVLLRRNRRGVNGDTIALWEFRTFGADSAAAVTRRTGLEKFLCKSRLKRLPLLLNMLRGDMPVSTAVKWF